MTTEYIKNGNFINEFKYWTQDSEFDLRFEPHQKGNSIYLPVGCAIEQSIPDMPGKTMRFEFEVRTDKEVEAPFFAVSVGGLTSDGVLQSSPIFAMTTHEWKKFSVRCYFSVPLVNCYVRAGTPGSTTDHQVPSDLDAANGPLWYANFSLFEEPEA